jgi:tetratricopeptide (TPR) repeat protein
MLRVMPRYLLAALLLSITAPVFAQRDRDTYSVGPQSFEVSGYVRLAENAEPAGNIPVRLERFNGGIVDQITTDIRGRFRFANLQRGYYKVIINAPGFAPSQQDADLSLLFKAFLMFELNRDKSKNTVGGATLSDVIDARAPTAAREEFVLGRTALVKKSQQDAVSHLQRAVSLYPEFFDAQLLLGTAFMDMRQWEKAESALQRSLEIKPDSVAAMSSLGEVYWRQKRHIDSEKLLQEALKLDDKSWHTYFTLGRLYWETDDLKKAAPAIGRTLQLKPDFAEAHLLAGNILLRFQQQERALAEYEEYLKLAPKGEFVDQARELAQKIRKAIAEKGRQGASN